MKRIVDVFQRQGFAVVARKILSRIWRQRAYELFKLDCQSAVMPESWPDLTFEVLDARNVGSRGALASQVAALDPENPEYIDDIRQDRVIGLAVLNGSHVVHCAFVFKKNKTAALLGLPSSAALIGNALTVSEFRGRGIQGLSVRARATIARQAGFKSVIAETAPANVASQRGMIKGGMQPLGRLNIVVVLNCLVIRWRRPEGFRFFDVCF